MANITIGGRLVSNARFANIDPLYGPYENDKAALAALGNRVTNANCIGLTIGIKQSDGTIKEFWLQPAEGNTTLRLVEKNNDLTKAQELTSSQKHELAANINDRVAKIDSGTSAVVALGYKVLNPNLSFAEQVNSANTIYEIKDSFDLGGESVTIPAGCVLKFDGGRVKNGTLSGILVTSSGKINAKELGCTYNDHTKGVENVASLKILEGVTNAIQLQVTDTLYLGSGYVEISNSIKIDGGGELRVSGFNGFKVIGNVEVENIKVYGSDIYTSGGTTSRFIDVQAGTPNDVTIKNCYFKGNVRALHSSKTTDTKLTQYFNNITIEGNTFEDIACQPSSVMFYLTDTNFRTLTFVGNKVHNFLGVFIFCGITNDSEHEDNIANFMATKGRNYYVSDNYVFNDIDFMPWENVAFYTEGEGYFTFMLGELGECVFENNSVSNIISNYRGYATYDSYLSVTNLTYRNNKIKNCLNLTGAYNELLKSKGLQGVGKYLDNIYLVEDLSSYFPNLTINNSVSFKDMQGNKDAGVLIVRGNTFDVHTWSQIDANHILFKKTYILDNYFHASYIGAGNHNVGLLGGVTNVIFENNVVEFDNYTANYISNNTIAPAVMVNTEPSKTFAISIKNNTLKNCVPTRVIYTYGDTGFVGEISNNIISYTLTRLKSLDVIIGSKVNDKLFVHDNTFAQNTSNQQGLLLQRSILANKCNLRFSVTTKTTLYLLYFSPATLSQFYATFGECFNIIFKTYDRTSGRGNVSEVKLTIANNDNTYSISSVKAYNINYVLEQISSASLILNHAAAEYASVYNLSLSPSQTYVAISPTQMVDNADFDIDVEIMPKMKANKYLYHPKSGVTARRPTTLDSSDVGFDFFDTTLGKTIFVKSVASDGTPTWVYADGDYIVDNSGTLQNRLALTSPVKGQQFKLTGGANDVYLIYGDYGWLKATDGTPWFDDSGTLNAIYDKYNYALLTEQPSDWTTKYNTYYKKVNDAYTLLTTTETWAADTYYKKDVNAYKGIQVKLTDTDTSLRNKVVKWDGAKYISIVDNTTLKAGTPKVTFTTENNTTTATITNTSSGKIYYTKDGNDPTSSSTEYSSAITLADGDQVKAICIRDHMDNSAPGFVPVSTPVITFSSAGILTITCETPNAKIYYTIDGNAPTTSSTEYDSSASVTIAKNVTVKAFAVLIGRVNSDVATKNY